MRWGCGSGEITIRTISGMRGFNTSTEQQPVDAGKNVRERAGKREAVDVPMYCPDYGERLAGYRRKALWILFELGGFLLK